MSIISDLAEVKKYITCASDSKKIRMMDNVDAAINALAEEKVPLKPLCEWLAKYALPPGNTSWLPLYGSAEKAWAAAIKDAVKYT